MKVLRVLLLLLVPTIVSYGFAQSCSGKSQPNVAVVRNLWVLDGGGVAAFSMMNVDFDGYGRAYHPGNYASGAILHLCNAGKVYLPDGTSYEGSESNATCSGRFMSDFEKIKAAGWKDPSVGAINWYGILGEGTATIRGKKISQVTPVSQQDGSVFFVSPTSLEDKQVKEIEDQSRYVNPLRVPFAVIPGALRAKGILVGSFGVAIDAKLKIPVPFVVADGGPRIGEGSAALARLVAGKPLSDQITKKNRSVGQVDSPQILWVFFGGEAGKYDHRNEGQLAADAQKAFDRWGGSARLDACLAAVPAK